MLGWLLVRLRYAVVLFWAVVGVSRNPAPFRK
jgi:hypothetical protein